MRDPARRSRSSRGSALIFAVVLIAAITIYFVAAQELMMASVRSQQRFEDRARARLALESAAAYMVSALRHGLITLPASTTVTVGGIDVAATAKDNAAAVPRTMLVDTSLSIKGRVFTDSLVLGQRNVASQWNYALFVDSNQTWSDVLTTGSLGANGDVYLGVNATGGTFTHTINGDLECPGTISSQFNVTGTKWPQAPSIAFNVPNFPTYSAAADTVFFGGAMNGFTFTDYGPAKTHLVYRTGDLTIEGNFVGNGVVFATGDIDIVGTITVSGGKLVIISDGNLRLKRNGASVAAFLFCENETVVVNAGMSVFGCLITSALDLNKNLTIVYDPYFWVNPSERARFKLPGFWP